MQPANDGTKVAAVVSLLKRLPKKSSLSSKAEVGCGNDEGRCTDRESVLVPI